MIQSKNDGEKFKSAGVQIVEHLKKENDSEYSFFSLTDVAKEIIRKARELILKVNLSAISTSE